MFQPLYDLQHTTLVLWAYHSRGFNTASFNCALTAFNATNARSLRAQLGVGISIIR